MPYKKHQDFVSLTLFHPCFKFQFEAGIEFLSGMTSVSIKSPGQPFTPNWGSNTHNSVWMGLGSAVLGINHKARAASHAIPHLHLPQHRSSSQGAEGTLHSPSAPDCTTPSTKELMVPYQQHCNSAEGQIQAHRKAAAEKILCWSGREWAHHYWIKCIYFCQHFYDSWIAFLLLEKSVQ